MFLRVVKSDQLPTSSWWTVTHIRRLGGVRKRGDLVAKRGHQVPKQLGHQLLLMSTLAFSMEGHARRMLSSIQFSGTACTSLIFERPMTPAPPSGGVYALHEQSVGQTALQSRVDKKSRHHFIHDVIHLLPLQKPVDLLSDRSGEFLDTTTRYKQMLARTRPHINRLVHERVGATL